MKVIVTGSNGLIGSELAATLQRAGDEVTRLVRHGDRAGRRGVGHRRVHHRRGCARRP